MWLVLGGHGQLGKCLQLSLTSHGIAYTAVGSAEVDITDVASVAAIMKQLTPDVVINAAAWTAVDDAESHEDEAYLINCVGARNVARSAKEFSSKLVHVSTDYVFSGASNVPFTEGHITAPVGAYGRTKLAGELAVHEEFPEQSLIVRTAWLYSEFGSNFARTMVRKALAKAPVRVVNDQLGQPTLATDLADHILALVAAGTPVGTYHGTNAGQATWYDFAKEIYCLVGADTALVTAVPSSEYPTRATRPAYSVLGHANTERARVALMRPWLEALTESIPDIIARVDQE